MEQALSPQVIVIYVSMAGVDGVETTQQVLHGRLDTLVVMLSSPANEDRTSAAVEAGAAAFLVKAPLSSVASASILTGWSQLPPRRRTAADLSPREWQVLGLVGQGLANKAISRRLQISERTVKVHLTSIFRRLGVTDRTQAALWLRDHPMRASRSAKPQK